MNMNIVFAVGWFGLCPLLNFLMFYSYFKYSWPQPGDLPTGHPWDDHDGDLARALALAIGLALFGPIGVLFGVIFTEGEAFRFRP